MSFIVDIDNNSGFCAGVIRAVSKAEDYISAVRHGGSNRNLFSLGAIVHNDVELNRLENHGLVTIDYDDLNEMVDATGEALLIRAHGEPLKTYQRAKDLGFEIIDCTCPVVLELQKKIKKAYEKQRAVDGQIVLFGKIGHAEVLGLIGQVDNNVVVTENIPMLLENIEQKAIDLTRPIVLFSQTTKSPAEYSELCIRLTEEMAKANGQSIGEFKETGRLKIHNTICSQVATRHSKLTKFAREHDIIVFVAGKSSSNGKVLCELCKSVNIRTYHIESMEDIKQVWFRPEDRVGVCGATSTPRWLLENVGQYIKDNYTPEM